MAKATMPPRFRLLRTLLVTERTTKPYNSLQRDRQAVLFLVEVGARGPPARL